MPKFTSENQPLKRGRTGRQRGLMVRSTSDVPAIPRGYRDHRRREAKQYAEYARAVLARLGGLSLDGMVTLREAARVTVDLERLAYEVETARGAPLRRAKRRQIILRTQLTRMEQRLEEMAASAKPRIAPGSALVTSAPKPEPEEDDGTELPDSWFDPDDRP